MSYVKTLWNSLTFGSRRTGKDMEQISNDVWKIPFPEPFERSPKTPDAPADLVEQANLAIEKCRERMLEAAESNKFDPHNSTHKVLWRLETDGAFSDEQMKIFRTRLHEIDVEVRQAKARIKLMKFITGVHEDEEKAEEAEKMKAIAQMNLAQNQMMANQMGRLGALQAYANQAQNATGSYMTVTTGTGTISKQP